MNILAESRMWGETPVQLGTWKDTIGRNHYRVTYGNECKEFTQFFLAMEVFVSCSNHAAECAGVEL